MGILSHMPLRCSVVQMVSAVARWVLNVSASFMDGGCWVEVVVVVVSMVVRSRVTPL